MAGKTPTDFDSLQPILDWLHRIDGQLRTLQAPQGTQLAGLLAQVQAAIVGIGAAVTAYLAGGFSTGSMTASGNVTVAGNVTAANVTGGNVFAQSISTLITASRVTAWGRTSDGFIATASSSERYKVVSPHEIDPLAVLSIEPVYYQWIELLQERDRRAALPAGHLDWNPDMHVGVEVGMVAERLHEAGLWEFVVYQRDSFDQLILTDTGEPIPEGIHYINWGVALQVVARFLYGIVVEQGAQIASNTARLDAAGL